MTVLSRKRIDELLAQGGFEALAETAHKPLEVVFPEARRESANEPNTTKGDHDQSNNRNSADVDVPVLPGQASLWDGS
jgi:hypothetical protein